MTVYEAMRQVFGSVHDIDREHIGVVFVQEGHEPIAFVDRMGLIPKEYTHNCKIVWANFETLDFMVKED